MNRAHGDADVHARGMPVYLNAQVSERGAAEPIFGRGAPDICVQRRETLHRRVHDVSDLVYA